MKTCTKCRIQKDLGEFYGKKIKKGNSYQYPSSQCKQCSRLLCKENRLKNRKIKEESIVKIEDGKKKCCNCEEIKNCYEFYKNKGSKDGLTYSCKSCKKIYESTYNVNNKEARRLIKKRCNLKYKDKIREYKKKYNAENKEKRNISRAEYFLKNPKAKTGERIRKNILSAISARGSKKSKNTEKLLGCSIDYCIKHLESQFTTGMTWENRGNNGWHIDHITPCDSFDLSDPEQQLICFNYKNLRPLWATTDIAMSYGEGPEYIGNLEKGCKIL